MSTRLLLIASDAEKRAKYLNALRTMAVEIDEIDSLANLEQATQKRPYAGILLDVATQVKCPREDRERLSRILDLYPIARLQWDSKREVVKTLLYIQHDEEDSLRFFAERYCPAFPPRITRAAERMALHFNVLLSTTRGGGEESPEKAVTLDVSSGGCFICTPGPWGLRQAVWFIATELESSAPIKGQVRWSIPWGSQMKVPGIGVAFMEIEDYQRAEIRRWLA